MYSVSAAYRQKMKDSVQRYRLTGQIIVGAESFSFTEKNIIKKSFTLTNQCSGNDSVEIGSVYTAELTATITGIDIPRYSLKGAQITASAWLWTESQWEEVPLGVFWIKEADWTTWGVEIVANDAMAFFDKDITWDTSYGTPWDLAQAACSACGVTLGPTKQEMYLMANGAVEFSVYTENDMETWRDLIYWVAVTTGTFATIDRAGNLQFVYYGSSPVDQIDSVHRFKEARFSDFKTRYTAVKLTSLVTGKTNEFALVPNDGLTLDLGKNPLLQYGSDQEIEARCRAILEKIQTIDYVPMQVSTYGLPVYDLGDAITFSEGAADQAMKSCITAFDWAYGSEYELTGVGQNPALVDARSKIDKNIAGLLSQTKDDKIQFYTFYNATAITIGDGETKTIINIRFASNRRTTVVFHAEVFLSAETKVDGNEYYDLIGTITYLYNEFEMENYHPKETWIDGDHILHLLYYFDIDSAIMNHLEVLLTANGGEIYIDAGSIRASVYGQSLAATDRWDGTITIRDDITQSVIGSAPGIYRTVTGTDSASITLQTPIDIGFSTEITETDNLPSQPSITPVGLTEELEAVTNDEKGG